MITNCPGFLLLAILGDKISNRLMFGAMKPADMICGIELTFVHFKDVSLDLHKMCHLT
jgi:hypothetical protein